MPLIEPRTLYDRLVEVTGARTDEELARKLDEGLRTIQRLKAGHGVEFDRTIALLGQAGWLTVPTAAEPNVERARLLAIQIADRLGDLADALGAPGSA